MNATLGSQSDFRCATTGMTVFWTVNGVTATKPKVMKHNISVSYDHASRSTLHILASAENNNSAIVCTAIDEVTLTLIPTMPAVLKIQGMFLQMFLHIPHITNKTVFLQGY